MPLRMFLKLFEPQFSHLSNKNNGVVSHSSSEDYMNSSLQCDQCQVPNT